MKASTTPAHHLVEEHVHEENDDDDLPNGGVTTEFNNYEDDEVHDPILERQTQAEKSQRLQDQLKVGARHRFILIQ